MLILLPSLTRWIWFNTLHLLAKIKIKENLKETLDIRKTREIKTLLLIHLDGRPNFPTLFVKVTNAHPEYAESSSAQVLMCDDTVNLNARAKKYPPLRESNTNGGSKAKHPIYENSFVPLPTGPLQIDKPIFNTILHPLKAMIHKAVFNQNAQAA